MTIQSIKMPDIGEGIAEVELVAWRVAVGDLVTEDQILADVMTDKATVEIPSHVSGTIQSLDAEVGQVVAVGTPIIHIKTAAAQANQGLTAIAIEAPKTASSPAAAVPSPQPSPGGRGSKDPATPSDSELPPLPEGEGWGEGSAVAGSRAAPTAPIGIATCPLSTGATAALM